MKTKADHIKAQLNADRLTPLQWDGIQRAMESYASEQLSEQRRKIEELRDYYNGLTIDSVTVWPIVERLDQILEETRTE